MWYVVEEVAVRQGDRLTASELSRCSEINIPGPGTHLHNAGVQEGGPCVICAEHPIIADESSL